jgi:hypothetical protein
VNWAKSVLAVQSDVAKRKGYAAPDITPEELVNLRLNTTHCFLCSDKISWSADRRVFPHLDHNHRTGKVRGYVHAFCNVISGNINLLHANVGRSGDIDITRNTIRQILLNWEPD